MLLSEDQDIAGGETGRTNDEAATRSKLWVYAEKTGVLGKKSVDINEFLDHQIEESYKKIEKALQNQAKDVEILMETVERLEGAQPDPEKAGDAYEIEQKIEALTKAAELRKLKLAEDENPVAWRPSGIQDPTDSTVWLPT